VSNRSLVLVLGLTFCDYLLWSWSLGGNHDVVALISGLTLPPLAVACLWLLVLSVARLLARAARGPGSRSKQGPKHHGRQRGRRSRARAAAVPEGPVAAASSDAPARKLAA
jgi:hypothetical protein